MDAKNNPQAGLSEITRRIQESLSKATDYTKHQGKLNSTLTLVTTIGSAVTAFITALTALQGPTVIPGVLDWQSACGIGAVLSLITTISSGVGQQLNVSQKLIDGSQCAGRLRALEFSAASKIKGAEELATEYADILRLFPNVIQ
ncbi:MAG: hypothetical protein IT310_10400 [Anaerolineales bacterium]|nr:hypothetical protein [Anaerolineales bacterium]